MPAFTPLGYPYPVPGDATNGPGAVKALADAVDASVASTLAAAAAATAPKAALTRNLTAQQLLNNIVTTLNLGSEIFDNDNLVDLAADAQNFTVRTAGVYHLQASFAFAANGTAHRRGFIAINGSSVASLSMPASTSATFATAFTLGTLRTLAVGNKVSIQAQQVAGVTLPLSYCQFAAHMVSP